MRAGWCGQRDGLRSRGWARRRVAAGVLAWTATAALAPAQALAARDFTGLSLEQLLNVEVTAVTKVRQRADQTAAAVTVIEGSELRAYGYRTLGEALRAVRGFHFSSDRTYDYVGVRGFAPPGDYNDRVLLAIDGHRINETLYDQGSYGSDFPLDLALVERIEIARGPGGAAFGANALFGVVNVITRRAADRPGAEVEIEAGSFGSGGLRLTAGREFGDGGELLVSASGFRMRGPSLYFPEFDGPGLGDGRIDGADFDRNERLFARFRMNGLSLTAGRVSRLRGNAASSYGTTFDDARNAIKDEQGFLELRLDRPVGPDMEATARLFVGDHYYYGDYLYGPPPEIVSPDAGRASWWGGEARLRAELSPQHVLMVGLEFQDNHRQDQWWDYPDPAGPLAFASRQASRRAGVFLHSHYRHDDGLGLEAGLRIDAVSGQRSQLSPRLGLVKRLDAESLLKLLYGTAFRAPNAYETAYAFPGQQIGNDALRPERIATFEGIYERYLAPNWRLTAAGYRYRMRGLIAQEAVSALDPATGLPVDVLQFRNQAAVVGSGLEFEIDGLFAGGARLRASLGLQRTRAAGGAPLDNSPPRLFKLNATLPLEGWRGSVGLELQAMAPRRSWNGRVPGTVLANLTLLRAGEPGGAEFSASVFNLFDRRYSDPAPQDFGLIAQGIVRDRIPQEGRNLRLRLTYRF